MTHTGLETRLLTVETARKALKRRLATLLPAPHWLDAIIGSCKGECFKSGDDDSYGFDLQGLLSISIHF